MTSLPVRTTGGAAGTSMRQRAVAADGVDHAGERGPGDGAGVDARIEGGDAAGHGIDDVGEAVGVDERGRPAHRVRRVVATRRAAAASALAQHGHHRASGRELDRPHRDLAQPADTRADVVAHVAGTRGDQPAEHLADGRARPRRPSRRRGRPRRDGRSRARRALRRRPGTWRPRRRRRWDSPGRPPRRRPGRAPTRAGGARRRARRSRARRGFGGPGRALVVWFWPCFWPWLRHVRAGPCRAVRGDVRR